MSDDDQFRMWTVYKFPRDFPHHYVARLWLVGRRGAVATKEVLTAQKLDALRELLPPELVRLKRDPNDDKTIIEIWI
jgi:hypothetical protein